MVGSQQTNSSPSEEDILKGLNSSSSEDQQTNLSSSDEEILRRVAMSRHSVEEISKNFSLLESEYVKLLKKQRTNILPGLIGNMAGGAIGGVLGTAIYNNWSTIAPALASAAEAIVAAAPVIGIVAGSIAAFGVALFCIYEICKYRAQIKKGAEYIGEKTIEGAKALGKGVKKGYEHSTNSLKRGTSRALDRSGSFLTKAAHSGEYSMESDFSQGILENKGIKDVVNDTIKAVKANDSCVLKTIQDTIKSLIDSKAEELKSKNVVGATDQNHNLEVESKLRKQSRVVDRLGTILTQNMPDVKSLELVTQIFSEYKGEIGGILKDYKENPKNYPKPTTLSRKVSESMSSSSLRRKSSNESEASSSIANSTASSQAELLDSGKNKKVESTSLFSSLRAKLPSWLGGKGASYNVAKHEQLSNASTPKTLSRSNSIAESTDSFGSFEDSGIGSSTNPSKTATVRRPRSSSPPSTPVKVKPPVVPSVAPQKAARAPSPSRSVTSTRTEVYTHPLTNGLNT